MIVQERNAGNAVTNEYVWGLNLGGGIGGMLNLKRSGADYSYLYDANGNVEAVLNASQQVASAYRYDPFGTLLAKTGTFDQPFQFSTKRYDARIGMVQYEFRNYLPHLGRWATRDPLGEAGGLNLYAFVGNNPVNWLDPWGLLTEVIISGGTWYGHVGLRINNQVYSVGRYNPNSVHSLGMKGDNILVIQGYKDYISYYQNHHRNSTGYVLDISPDNEKKWQQNQIWL